MVTFSNVIIKMSKNFHLLLHKLPKSVYYVMNGTTLLVILGG